MGVIFQKRPHFNFSMFRQVSGNVKFVADFDIKFLAGFNFIMCNDYLQMSNLWPFLNRQLSGNVKFVADFDVNFVADLNFSICNDYLKTLNLWPFLNDDPHE